MNVRLAFYSRNCKSSEILLLVKSSLFKMSVSLFKVLLDKEEYFAGELIQGSILILVEEGAHEQITNTGYFLLSI